MNFIKDFILLDIADYENFGISFPLGIFITVFTVALIISCFVIAYRKMRISEILQKLLRREATSEAAALTLAELRLDNKAVRNAFLRGGKITHIVKICGEEKMSYEEYVALSKKRGYKPAAIDFENARFYIDKDMLSYAEDEVINNTPSWLHPIFLSLALVAIWLLFAIFAEDILMLLNSSAS